VMRSPKLNERKKSASRRRNVVRKRRNTSAKKLNKTPSLRKPGNANVRSKRKWIANGVSSESVMNVMNVAVAVVGRLPATCPGAVATILGVIARRTKRMRGVPVAVTVTGEEMICRHVVRTKTTVAIGGDVEPRRHAKEVKRVGVVHTVVEVRHAKEVRLVVDFRHAVIFQLVVDHVHRSVACLQVHVACPHVVTRLVVA